MLDNGLMSSSSYLFSAIKRSKKPFVVRPVVEYEAISMFINVCKFEVEKSLV